MAERVRVPGPDPAADLPDGRLRADQSGPFLHGMASPHGAAVVCGNRDGPAVPVGAAGDPADQEPDPEPRFRQGGHGPAAQRHLLLHHAGRREAVQSPDGPPVPGDGPEGPAKHHRIPGGAGRLRPGYRRHLPVPGTAELPVPRRTGLALPPVPGPGPGGDPLHRGGLLRFHRAVPPGAGAEAPDEKIAGHLPGAEAPVGQRRDADPGEGGAVCQDEAPRPDGHRSDGGAPAAAGAGRGGRRERRPAAAAGGQRPAGPQRIPAGGGCAGRVHSGCRGPGRAGPSHR